MSYFQDDNVKTRNVFQRISKWCIKFLVTIFSQFVSVFILVVIQIAGIEVLLFFTQYTLSLQRFFVLFLVRILYVLSAMSYSRMHRYCSRYSLDRHEVISYRAVRFFWNGSMLFGISLALAILIHLSILWFFKNLQCSGGFFLKLF